MSLRSGSLRVPLLESHCSERLAASPWAETEIERDGPGGYEREIGGRGGGERGREREGGRERDRGRERVRVSFSTLYAKTVPG